VIVTVHREHLLPALMKIAGVVEKKQTLPILGNILFQVKDGKMLLIGTDSELEIKTISTIDSGEDGLAFTLSARKFGDICKALPEHAEIRIAKDGERISIRSGRSHFTIGTLPFEDFPSLEILPANYSFTLESTLLKRLLEHTAFSMGHQDARYYLNGLLLDLNSERLRCVATDGHRLALSDGKVTTGQKALDILLPRKAVFELIRLLDDAEQTVTV
jgi:DNA polymerase-3 subunit beta